MNPRFDPVGVVFVGRNLSDFWEVAEKSPVINYTFTSSMPGGPGECEPPRLLLSSAEQGRSRQTED